MESAVDVDVLPNKRPAPSEIPPTEHKKMKLLSDNSSNVEYSNPFAISDILNRIDSGKFGSVTKDIEALKTRKMQILGPLLKVVKNHDEETRKLENKKVAGMTHQNVIDLEGDHTERDVPAAPLSVMIIDSDEDDDRDKKSFLPFHKVVLPKPVQFPALMIAQDDIKSSTLKEEEESNLKFSARKKASDQIETKDGRMKGIGSKSPRENVECMTRTRRGNVERRRSIVSARRQCATARAPKVKDELQQQEVLLPATEALVPATKVPILPESYPGGPQDTSVLKSFSDHVATRLWTEEDRGELKVVTHGKKLAEFVIDEDDHYTREMVVNSGLAPLLICSYRIVDKGLLSAFAERWHKDTGSFHLPCGEITITLDDVSSLLHLPITGEFFTHPIMDRDIACLYLVSLLGVTMEEAIIEMNATPGAHVRFSWLRDVYRMQVEQGNLDRASRAFLLHLVGCTLFADKSATYVDVAFLELFRDVASCSRYAWGAAALTYLYEHLNDASMHRTRQIGGYMTLFQAWVFEHFPTIGIHHLSEDYTEETPRARRWTPVRGVGQVLPFRTNLDQLFAEDVCWMPYGDHREHRPFQDISLYSGYIRWGPLKHAHLPERVLRQYGYVQGIPRSPHGVVPSAEQIDDRWMHYVDHLVDIATRGPRVTHPAECVHGYMYWFHRISHPYVIPPREGAPPTVPVVDPARMPSSSSSGIEPSMAKFERIFELLQSLLDLRMVTEGTEAWQITREALNIARSGTGDGVTYKKRRSFTQ